MKVTKELAGIYAVVAVLAIGSVWISYQVEAWNIRRVSPPCGCDHAELVRRIEALEAKQSRTGFAPRPKRVPGREFVR